uniref:Peptidase A1 domain-containing protein n=3 Tax=Guillardia theta TaxID=55529 RepID=A0A7S4UTA5_GUITH|mmetsp:Transcript_46092/g.144597  ORF Transcript_46092/g.144597 Transcript_46092/m.144597 type:complete len:131 (+) Transcript_46092:402-794(+)
MTVNGYKLDFGDDPVYTIVDTGTTGLTMSRELYEEILFLYASKKISSKARLWKKVSVSLEGTEGGVEIEARNPITTPVDIPWPKFRSRLLVLGLSFIEGTTITLDLKQGYMSIVDKRQTTRLQPDMPKTI